MLGYRLAKSITVTSKCTPSIGSITKPPRYFLSLITASFAIPADFSSISFRLGIRKLFFLCS